ncbi:TetR/AcrR family transcriptional regulator [Nocardioides silvaticus]|uniref:TetR/AcrR family transcriptional regulator n=1 Tax=Nocardioides silvaticus TaxID=2201891 RepID=A0A316THI6_9ACTN|nr:TetR/AcrR family transcriptional regulator [Nocardioides silvaticus]PWN03258.1 TetR/AcrR family transcriptional regulator [Nocardioides silvaticus]
MSRASTLDLRARLLRAAEAEIAATGPARASLRAIARRCGVSHQATAHHFVDRAGLFTALALEGHQLLLEETQAAIDATPAVGGQRVAAAGAAYIAFAHRHPALFDLMFRPDLLHDDDEELAAARLAHRDLSLANIAAAQERGWGTEVPTAELAVLGWAAVHGLAVLEREQIVSVLYPEVDVDSILRRVVHVLDALG